MNKSGSNNSGAIDADEAARRAERSLELGDPIGALNWVSLRTEPAALALVGSALARLQDWVGARRALRKASQGYGLENPTAQARCDIALAEVALVFRELGHDEGPLVAAIEHLESRGDGPNARYGRLVLARYRVLLGRIDGAIAALSPLVVEALSLPLQAVLHLVRAEASIRSLRGSEAAAALVSAEQAALAAGDPALQAEIQSTRLSLARPAAQWVHGDVRRTCTVLDVESLLATHSLVVDGCRRRLRSPDGDVDTAFGHDEVNDDLRGRLRVDIGRLRAVLRPQAGVVATEIGYALGSVGDVPLPLLLPPVPGASSAITALLSDGAVIPLGHGLFRRWRVTPLAAIATALLLPLHRITSQPRPMNLGSAQE